MDFHKLFNKSKIIKIEVQNKKKNTVEVPKHQQSVQLIDVHPDDSPRILTDLVQYFFFIIL